MKQLNLLPLLCLLIIGQSYGMGDGKDLNEELLKKIEAAGGNVHRGPGGSVVASNGPSLVIDSSGRMHMNGMERKESPSAVTFTSTQRNLGSINCVVNNANNAQVFACVGKIVYRTQPAITSSSATTQAPTQHEEIEPESSASSSSGTTPSVSQTLPHSQVRVGHVRCTIDGQEMQPNQNVYTGNNGCMMIQSAESVIIGGSTVTVSDQNGSVSYPRSRPTSSTQSSSLTTTQTTSSSSSASSSQTRTVSAQNNNTNEASDTARRRKYLAALAFSILTGGDSQ